MTMNDAPPTRRDSNFRMVGEAIPDVVLVPPADVQFLRGEGARAILREVSAGRRSVPAAGLAPIGESLSNADHAAVGR